MDSPSASASPKFPPKFPRTCRRTLFFAREEGKQRERECRPPSSIETETGTPTTRRTRCSTTQTGEARGGEGQSKDSRADARQHRGPSFSLARYLAPLNSLFCVSLSLSFVCCIHRIAATFSSPFCPSEERGPPSTSKLLGRSMPPDRLSLRGLTKLVSLSLSLSLLCLAFSGRRPSSRRPVVRTLSC